MARLWLILFDISWTLFTIVDFCLPLFTIVYYCLLLFTIVILLFTIVYDWRQGLFEEIVVKAGERRQISREGKRRERKGSPHLGLLNSVLCAPYVL